MKANDRQIKKVIPIPPKSKEQQEAQRKYMSKMARIGLTMTPEKKQRIQDHADRHGESVNAFINRAIDEAIEREKTAP